MFTAKLPGVSGIFRIMLMAVMLAVSAGCQNLASDDAKVVSQLKVGSIITFGRHIQTESCELRPIEWRVLEVKDNKALLLADKGLDSIIPYNNENVDVTWETSFIRRHLNQKYYNWVFNDSEKSRIVVTTIKNPDNPSYGTKGGDDTSDRIFLLSLDEAERYFKNDAERMLKPTPCAARRGNLDDGKYYDWWLRSPGSFQDHASSVFRDGSLDSSGNIVHYSHRLPLLRPALWIKL